MHPLRVLKPVTICAMICVLCCPQALFGQTPDQSKRQDQTEVLRVYTELVQTDVMVFDKQGKFVPGLTREDFELKIDGKPKAVEFFEKITAGSADEESQLAAARGSSARPNLNKSPDSIPLDRGRPVFFYVDDFHLDAGGMKATRDVITRFIENEMGQNDEAAISSASGQIGFLQQLTDDKGVLRAALKRLNVRPYSSRDFESPPMTEYQATLIENHDRELLEYFVDEVIRRTPEISRGVAEAMVLARARTMVQMASNVSTNTLAGLEGLVKSAKELPGRKLVFFISGGFFLGEQGSEVMDRLRRITSAASRNGVVIYSLDARGLVGSLRDASSESQIDPSGRLQRSDIGELGASQDAMNALALDTGGRTVFNSNSLGPGLVRALKETSVYYLLAWKPEQESQHASKFRRIEVKVVGKPDLVVQVRRGLFDVDPEAPPTAKVEKPNAPVPPDKTPVAELRKVMLDQYPNRGIPVSLYLSYISTPDKGPMLTAFMQMPKEFLSYVNTNGQPVAVLDVAGTVFNDKGQAGAAFNNRLTLGENANRGQDPSYGYNIYIKPGLYQIRVGVRDDKTGHAGSANGWIEIPDLSAGQLTLSSLLVGGRMAPPAGNGSTTDTPPATTEVRLARRFSSSDFLRFMVFVYNAGRAPADAKPDVALQVQVVRDGQPVVTAPQKKISVEGVTDLGRLPYAAEVPLTGLPPGLYVLQVTVVDRVSKQSSSQQIRFEIR